MKLRVMLADDHPLVRLCVRGSLAADGIEVVGEASSGSELLGLLDAAHCDAVVTDLAMPDAAGDACEGVNFVRRLRERWPSLPVVVLTGETDQATLRAVLNTGIAGMMRKSDPPDALPFTVRDACRGRVSVSEGIWSGLASADTHAAHPSACKTSPLPPAIRGRIVFSDADAPGYQARGYGAADLDRLLSPAAARHAHR